MLMEDQLSPNWGQRFWAEADCKGGAWEPAVQDILQGMLRDAAPAICAQHAVVRNSTLALADQLEMLPPYLHAALCERTLMRAPQQDSVPYVALEVVTSERTDVHRFCAYMARLGAALPQLNCLQCLEVTLAPPVLHSAAALASFQSAFQKTTRVLPRVALDLDFDVCSGDHARASDAVLQQAARLAQALGPGIVDVLLTWDDPVAAAFADTMLQALTRCRSLHDMTIDGSTHSEPASMLEVLCQELTAMTRTICVKLLVPVEQATEARIAASLRGTQHLRNLHLTCSQCKGGLELRALPPALASMSLLQVLRMQGGMRAADQVQLADSIGCLTALKELCLPTATNAELLQPMSALTDLTCLEVGGTAMRPFGAEDLCALAQALRNLHQLQHLAISGGCKRAEGHIAAVQECANALQHLQQLTALGLTIGATSSTLASTLAQLTHLRALHFRFSRSEHDMAAQVATMRSLARLTSLHLLSLLDVSNLALDEMACSIKHLCHLTSLTVHPDTLSSCLAVCQALSATTALVELTLFGKGDFDANCMAALAESLPRHPGLTLVELDGLKELVYDRDKSALELQKALDGMPLQPVRTHCTAHTWLKDPLSLLDIVDTC